MCAMAPRVAPRPAAAAHAAAAHAALANRLMDEMNARAEVGDWARAEECLERIASTATSPFRRRAMGCVFLRVRVSGLL